MLELKVKECAGYEIIDRVIAEDRIEVLAKRDLGDWDKYATWTTWDGENFYHGHYFHDYRDGRNVFEDAREDMFERAGYVKKPTKNLIDQMEDEGYFGIVRWCDEDLKAVLEQYNVEPTEENVNMMRDYVDIRNFEEFMIERGWDYIYSCVQDLIDDLENESEE